MNFKEKIFDLAKILCSNSESRLKIVRHQEDTTENTNLEAAHFLKLDGKRLGRDLELYDFMSEIQNEKATVCDVLQEILFPLKKILPLSYEDGKIYMAEWGKELFPDEQLREWQALFD